MSSLSLRLGETWGADVWLTVDAQGLDKVHRWGYNESKPESKAVTLVMLRLVKVLVRFGFVSLQNSLDSSVDL